MIQHFIAELQRRKVLRVAATYLVGAWVVLQVAVALQTAWKLTDTFSGTILNLMIIGFPVVVGLAWFFEITPQGIKRTATSGDGTITKLQTTDYVLAGALALVFFLGVTQVLWLSAPAVVSEKVTADGNLTDTETPKIEPPRLGDKSIAVLPFKNLSPDKDDAFFADGLTDEILNIIARLPDVKVIARTSSFLFKDKTANTQEVAQKLAVRYVLQGSVWHDADEIRVTAQLIDATTGALKWSRKFEQKFSKIFAVQDDIARAIAGELNIELATSSSLRNAPTANLQAYSLYLRARELFLRRLPDDVPNSIELYEQAIKLDPRFADARAGLAASLLAQASKVEGLRNFVLFDTLAPRARNAAETAARLNPNLVMAHATLGALATFETRWQDAEEYVGHATSLNPEDSVTLGWISLMRTITGELDAAEAAAAKIDRIDPLYSLNKVRAMPVALTRADDDKAGRLAQKVSQSSVAFGKSALWTLAVIAHDAGDADQAEKFFRAFMSQSKRDDAITEPVVRAIKFAANRAAALEAIEKHRKKDPTFEPERICFFLGDDDAYFDALNVRLANGETGRVAYMSQFGWRRIFQGKGLHPKHKELMRKLGLVDYWKKHGWPDRCRPKGEDDFECS